jgi:ATP-binding cassette subfamily B protein
MPTSSTASTAAPPAAGAASTRRVFAGLWDAARAHAGPTALAVVLMVLAKVAAVGVPLVLKTIVDRLSRPQQQLSELVTSSADDATRIALVLPVFLLLGYALLRFAGTLFTELRDLVFARVTQRTVTLYAQRIFAHLLSLSPRFHARRSTGVLIREIERGTAGVGFLLGTGLFTVVPTLIELAAVVAILAAGYDIAFTLAIFATFVVYATYTTAVTHKRALRQRRVNAMDARASGRLVDSLINYETVKAYAREELERRRHAEICGLWVEESLRNQRALSTLHIGQSAIIAFGVAAVMLLAGQQTVRGAMTVGDLVLVNSYIIQVCLPLNALGFVFREARDALVNCEALFGLLALEPDIVDAPDAPPLEVRGGEVRFEHVEFGYEPGRQILFDVSFTIPPGATVAVVGGSGSGKSTLARLLLRFYDTDRGRVLVDGQDVRAVQAKSLRDAIGLVPQDTVLFNDTIAYNIGYGRPQAGMAEIVAAAQAAQLHEFIQSLPEQYETLVGERGTKLSGGERQRLAIARAFLKDPPLVIFDEATSALDTRAERAIQGELDRVAEGRSTLVIAHRLSTIVDADEIIVLDKGRIVERGRHDELLAAEGLYAQLWNLQRQQREFDRLERRLARQPVNLAVLIAGTLDSLRWEIERRRVAVYSEILADHARIEGDASTLSEMLRRLAWQALHATPVGGRMELRLEREQDMARLAVTDGRHLLVAAADATPLAAARESSPAGTDAHVDPLQVRSLVERHGGRFHVDAATSSHGLRFVVELPLRPDDAAAPGPLLGAGEIPLGGAEVLCIEEDATPASAHALLGAAGARAHAFASGRAALDWLAARPDAEWPDWIVCDLDLDDVDGFDLVRQLRRLEDARGLPLDRRTPAIALARDAAHGEDIRALMAGFQGYVVRPLTRESLSRALHNAGPRRADGGGASFPAPNGVPHADPRPAHS